MKQIKLTVYRVSELDESVKARVIDHYRDINVDDESWYECEIENTGDDLAEIGITIDPQKVFFDLHDRTITMDEVQIDLDNSNLQKELWKDADWNRFLSAMSIEALVHTSKKVSDYIYGITIDWGKGGLTGLTLHFEYDEEAIIDLFGSDRKGLTAEETSNLIGNLEARLVRILDDAAQNLLKQLDTTYYDLITDESVMETLEENEFMFTKAGTHIRSHKI